MTIDLDALEKLAEQNLGYRWYELRRDIVTCGGGIGPDFVATPSESYKDYILAFQPATIKALISELKEARGVLQEWVDFNYTTDSDAVVDMQSYTRNFLLRERKMKSSDLEVRLGTVNKPGQMTYDPERGFTFDGWCVDTMGHGFKSGILSIINYLSDEAEKASELEIYESYFSQSQPDSAALVVDWQDISTAPRDGTLVDLWDPQNPLEDKREVNCWYGSRTAPSDWFTPCTENLPDGWHCVYEQYGAGKIGTIEKATHWKPITRPAAPVGDARNGKGEEPHDPRNAPRGLSDEC